MASVLPIIDGGVDMLDVTVLRFYHVYECVTAVPVCYVINNGVDDATVGYVTMVLMMLLLAMLQWC